MAKENKAETTNRDQVQSSALALIFGKEKAQPMLPLQGATDKGSLTYSSVRKWVTTNEPELTGDAKTARVNAIMNQSNAIAIATVAQLAQDGFHVRRLVGRELKNGSRSVSVGLTNAPDRSATPTKKIGDYTAAELKEMAAKKEEAEKATTLEVAAEVVAD